MNEMKTISFWKSLEIMFTGARVGEAKVKTNRWPIVRLEGISDLPVRLPKRAVSAERSVANDGPAMTSAPSGVRGGGGARPPPRRFSLGFLPE